MEMKVLNIINIVHLLLSILKGVQELLFNEIQSF